MDGNSRRPKATKRKKPVKECPNPLFLKWLERWRDEAKAKESKLQYVYNKAISSLKKYPLPLENGKEAMILEGVGAGIAKQLDEELVKHKHELQNNVVLDPPDEDITELDFPDMRVPPPPNLVAASPTVNGTSKSPDDPKPKKKRKSSPREYIPVFRSGPYAMMMALLKASEGIGYKGYLNKAELQQQAQPYTDTSFTVPEPDSYYTAWSSMSTLIKKGLVVKSSNPARFSLTDAGYALADKLTTASATHNSTLTSPSSSQTLPKLPTAVFSPPSTASTSSVPKPRTPVTPRARGVSKPSTPTVSPRTTSSPSSTLQRVNNLPAIENILPCPSYGNPSKDFLASYRFKTSGTEAMPCQLGSLEFWYVGSDGECVDHQDKAAVIIDDQISFGYLIKCRKSELENAEVEYKVDYSRQSKDGHVFAYISSQSVARLSEPAESVPTKKKSSAKIQAISTLSEDDSDDEMLMRPLFERLGGNKIDNEVKTSIVTSSKKSSHGSSVDIPDIISITESSQPKVATPLKPSTSKEKGTKPSLLPEIISITESSEPTTSRPSTSSGNVRKSNLLPTSEAKSISAETIAKPNLSKTTKSMTVPVKKPSNDRQPSQTQVSIQSKPIACQEKQVTQIEEPSDSSNKVQKIITPVFELKAGSFEVILCVDFIETTGGSKTTRKEEMVKELRLNGVSFDVRKLNVGDFLWIAREITLPLPGQLVLPERRELVLDYIVERKRMDDLCSSIKDGRFKEQKFRLLNSGLKHPVYLVEDFGSMNFMSMPAQTLEQAIVNTQVGQEFFVKRTRDIKESAAYLTLMTRYLQTSYENQTLKAIKREDMEHLTVEENQVNTFLMTFQELNDISVKNRILTVGELYGKQLLQIPGVAAEKVVGIMEHYPTLRDLLEAYEDQTTEKAKESMLSDIKFGKTQRKIGPSVSKTVYQLYCAKGALS